MEREEEEEEELLLEFRRPQSPRLGTNKWGGATPLLARNIPKESLQQNYYCNDFSHATTTTCTSTNKRSSRGRGILSKLRFFRKSKTHSVTLGFRLKKRRWLPRLDPTNRWPNGWC